jgi:hypothetical protein
MRTRRRSFMTQSMTGFALALVLATVGCAGSEDTELHDARLLRLEGADGDRSDKPSGDANKPAEETAASDGTKEGTSGGDDPNKPREEAPPPEEKPAECIISKIVRETCTSNDELETIARREFTNIKSLTFANDCERGSTIVKVYHCG